MARKKFEIRIVIFLWKTDKLNSKISNFVCVNIHKISKSWILFVCFPQKYYNSDFKFFPCQNKKLIAFDDILITYKYVLILAAEFAKIKFLKSRKKPTLSDVLDFASLNFSKRIRGSKNFKKIVQGMVTRNFGSKTKRNWGCVNYLPMHFLQCSQKILEIRNSFLLRNQNVFGI